MSKVSEKLADSALGWVLDNVKSACDLAGAHYKAAHKRQFNNYVINRINYCRTIKNLFYRTDAVLIEDIFVTSEIRYNRSKYSPKNFVTDIIINKNYKKDAANTSSIFIRGGAGSGKSFFMRMGYLKVARLAKGKIPIFVQAVDLNQIPASDFVDVMVYELNKFGERFSRTDVEVGLNANIFVLFLDGFDELRRPVREHYRIELDAIAARHKHFSFVISGRHNERSAEIQHAHYAKILPFSPSQVEEMIDRLDADDKLKFQFISKLNDGVYETHSDYIKTPILVIIMFITFCSIGRISDKRPEFYEDCFNALWEGHDLKKGLERKKESDLDKAKFLRCFSEVSKLAYFEDKLSISDFDFCKYINSLNERLTYNINKDKFQNDLVYNVGFMLLDNNEMNYPHRTFQEYFTALYYTFVPDDFLKRDSRSLVYSYYQDTVIDILFRMSREKIEYNIIWPIIKKNYQYFEGEFSVESYIGLFREADSYDETVFNMSRSIYGFKPDLDEIRVALHAMSDMIESSSSRYEVPSSFNNLLRRDFTNMSALARRLQHTYRDET